VLFIVYALNGGRNGVAEQAVGADRHAASRRRRERSISLCARVALSSGGARPLNCTLGAIVKLSEAISMLPSASGDLCIVAKRPWTPDSECELIELAADGRVPDGIRSSGYEYFLEVDIARDEVLKHAPKSTTGEQRLSAVIHYAEFDATPEWFNKLCRSP
jgi:hypothetical protein